MSENQNIEYKSVWRDEYLKWICGFANANGGTIFIGKNDLGEVVGVSDSKRLLEEIPNKVRDTMGIIVEVNLKKSKQLHYLEIITESYPYPVNYKGQYHFRSGSTKQELKGSVLDKYLLQKKGKRWDGVPVPNVSIKELKSETFDLFRNRALRSQRIEETALLDTNEQLIENLQLNEGEYLKRASILLFHSNPEKWITGAYVKIGYFQSDDDLRFQDEIHGNLFEQIEKTMDMLYSKYIKSEISYQGINRIETPEYPKEAVREALMNAIAHKDYSGGIPIQISVYADKIIFWNEGQLPENWTVKTLLEKHASRPYNPDIANTLFRSGYIESWGLGTIKIIRECRQVGIPAPMFNYNTTDISVTFSKEVYHENHLNTLGLNERQIDALLFFKEQREILTSDYMKRYRIVDRTARRDLTELTEKGLLIREGELKSSKYVFR